MRLFPIIAAVLLLAACDTTSTAITPATVGDLHIGMPAMQVQGLEGTFNTSQLHDECLQMPTKGHGLLLIFQQGSLSRIDIVRGNYHTPEGIHIGSTEAEAKAAYGKRLTVKPHKYEKNGHYLNVISAGSGYVFETNGKTITRIRVGILPSLTYVEGCA